MKDQMVKIGNFFFKYRNMLFPVTIVLLYILATPPSEILNSVNLEKLKDVIAITIALLGLVVRGVVIGYAYIKRGGVNKKVYADNLVTEGMFSICRNPLYVGNLLIYLGVLLMHGDPLVLILGSVFFLFIYQCIVYAEEAYLLNKFGEGYLAYCADVPRWIPKLSHFHEATQGMEFNFKRVIIKDYTTMANTFIALALTEGYEDISVKDYESLTLMLFIVAASLIWAATVRYFKKRPA